MPGSKKHVSIIFFKGIAIFDYLGIFFGFFGDVIIFGSRSAPGFRREAPCDSRRLSR
jgi:hypothetical protein